MSQTFSWVHSDSFVMLGFGHLPRFTLGRNGNHARWQVLSLQPLKQHLSEVALAFEQMRTPHASGREICAQKLGIAYQQNVTFLMRRGNREKTQTRLSFSLSGKSQLEKRMAHQTIQRNTEMLFANDARFPFTILVCLP